MPDCGHQTVVAGDNNRTQVPFQLEKQTFAQFYFSFSVMLHTGLLSADSMLSLNREPAWFGVDSTHYYIAE
ncbi:hypothetical protein [Photobacterium nomapromontoriensis]|uniref:hypothetical protein n=1 Tax=Photobacterium nomapromontoriensis TaxID=2910237 RepID=UPI003D0B5ACF